MDQTEIEREERLRELVKERVRNFGLGLTKRNSLMKNCMLAWKFLMIREFRLDISFSSMGCVLIFRACSSEKISLIKFAFLFDASILFTKRCLGLHVVEKSSW